MNRTTLYKGRSNLMPSRSPVNRECPVCGVGPGRNCRRPIWGTTRKADRANTEPLYYVTLVNVHDERRRPRRQP